MTRIIYATQAQCDGCGATAQLPPPTDSKLGLDTPPGWLPPGLELRDMFGSSVIRDLCGACMARPLADLLAPLIARAAESA